MKIEVEIVSTEIIKPSSSTPDDHRTYQLSFLDQISPPVFNPLVMFFSSKPDTKFSIVELTNQLKKSLSDVLTQFYPLAGRAHGNLFIDCNDQGIPFLETRVKCQLSDVIQAPIPMELNKFIPFQVDEVAELSLGVQLNIFDCGGIAIGMCISHKIADALSFFTFIKSWAATARQQEGHINIAPPQFVSAKLFPPKNISGFNPRVGMVKESIITKMFVFDASKIQALRAKYSLESNQGNPQNPSSEIYRKPTSVESNQQSPQNPSPEIYQKPTSRVEALSAFIWSRYVAAATQVSSELSPKKLYAIVHAVNLRTRIDPPLPESSFGNLYRIAVTIPSLDSGEEASGVVKQVRDSVRQIDEHYVRKLQEGNEHLDFIKQSAVDFFKGEMVTLSFTSLCRFPLYDADFGWGKPTWVGSPALTFNNLIVFMDAKSGGGIEAYINMKEDDLARIERDEEFLAYVCPSELK